MERLFRGIKNFSENEFNEHRELYEDLRRQQNPHTLFIGCSDSRVLPGKMLDLLPGELFMIRNVANIVPPAEAAESHQAVIASLEYAVHVLEVENIIICGHSNCGGCKALSKTKEEMALLPHTYEWLAFARPAFDKVEAYKQSHSQEALERFIEQENIVAQINHLLTYDAIKAKVEAGKLKIYGWYYDIGTGKFYNYDRETHLFDLV